MNSIRTTWPSALHASLSKVTASAAGVYVGPFDEVTTERALLIALARPQNLCDWIGSVVGADLEAAARLVARGACLLRWPGATGPRGTAPHELLAELMGLEWQALYRFMTHQLARLGVVRGCRLALAIERCQRLSELHALAIVLVNGIWELDDPRLDSAPRLTAVLH